MQAGGYTHFSKLLNDSVRELGEKEREIEELKAKLEDLEFLYKMTQEELEYWRTK